MSSTSYTLLNSFFFTLVDNLFTALSSPVCFHDIISNKKIIFFKNKVNNDKVELVT